MGHSHFLDFRIVAKALRSISSPSSFGSLESSKPVSLPPPASIYQGEMTVKLKVLPRDEMLRMARKGVESLLYIRSRTIYEHHSA